ncbi:MAG TPA: hypothetical protein VGF97_15490 [Rhizomicrobium sp.]|jgi:hypothetical protein
MEVIVVVVLLGIISGLIAALKGHNFFVWWLGTKRKCPHCTKTINAAAMVCAYCARDVPARVPAAMPPPLNAEQRRSIIAIAAVLVVIAGGYLAIQRWMDHENAVDLAYLAQLGRKGPTLSREEIERRMNAGQSGSHR